MKWTTLTFKELAAQKTLRMDAGYWIKKKASSAKLQAPRTTKQGGRVGPQATSAKQQAPSATKRPQSFTKVSSLPQVMDPTSSGPARAQRQKLTERKQCK
tara:strand:+ start:564 stop:863 length:300 start_codon:yes stop_codon:yes gene_type:complete